MKKTLLFLSILSSTYFVSAQVCNVIAIGGAPSATGSAGGEKRQLSYDKDLNTIAFIHKTTCDFFSYDISTDGGTTWSSNQQSIYGPVSNPSCVSHPGKLPKGMIYNPAGNTNPASAHLAYAGIWSGTPGGKVNGTGHFDLSSPNENYDNLPSGDAISVEDIFVSKTGESWMVGKLMNGFIFQCFIKKIF